MTTSMNNPHDRLFKKLMSDVKIARDFLEIHLPNPIKAECDLTKLQVAPGSYVEDDLKQHYSDILYRLEMSGKPGYIYCLIEHVSQAKRLTPFQVLRYQISIMKQALDQGSKTLPIVVPLLFYRGEKSPYPYSLNLLDCFEDPELAKKVWGKPPHLIDLSVIPDEELKTYKSVALLELLQKHIHTRDALKLAHYLVERALYQALSPDQFQSVLYYIEEAGNVLDEAAFLQFLEHSPLEGEYKHAMRTVANYLRNEGLQQGLHQGLQKGSHQMALSIAKNMLTQGSELEFIKLVTGLTDDDLEALK